MKVIILAGGKATRLPKQHQDKPKILLEIGGQTILEHQINLFERHGFPDIRLSLGDKASAVIDFLDNDLGGRYEYVLEPEPLDTGGAIKGPGRVDFYAGNGKRSKTFAFKLWDQGTLHLLLLKEKKQ